MGEPIFVERLNVGPQIAFRSNLSSASRPSEPRIDQKSPIGASEEGLEP